MTKVMKILLAAMASSAAMISGTTGASATTIATYDFNNYVAGSGPAFQPGTGLPLYAFGDLSDFDKSGQNAIHAVERSNGNYAVMLYNGNTPSQANIIVAKSGIAANALGQGYHVSFLSAVADYSSTGELTQGIDGLLFKLLDSTNTAVASYQYSPISTAFTSTFFDYTGTGTGLVKLSIEGVGNNSQFGGAVDDVSVAAVPETATWAMMLVGLGAVGFAMRRRQTVRVAYA